MRWANSLRHHHEARSNESNRLFRSLGLLRCARNDGLDGLVSQQIESPADKENRQMTVRAGREFLAIPGPTTMPDEVLQAMHRPALDIYSDQMVRIDRQPARRSLETVRDQGPILHLHRQRPWRMGSDALQRAVARRQAAGAGERTLCDRLGSGRGRDGRRGRGAQGRLAPRDPARRGRGAAEAGQGSQHQGDRGGAGRYGLGRL